MNLVKETTEMNGCAQAHVRIWNKQKGQESGWRAAKVGGGLGGQITLPLHMHQFNLSCP